jgi:hypothetical protein
MRCGFAASRTPPSRLTAREKSPARFSGSGRELDEYVLQTVEIAVQSCSSQRRARRVVVSRFFVLSAGGNLSTPEAASFKAARRDPY